MKAVEALATFNEKGEIFIENLPNIKNKKVKLLFLFEDDAQDDFYTLSARGLAKAYSDDEPEYDTSLLKEPNPLYKNEGR
jgi:hypothetical protein